MNDRELLERAAKGLELDWGVPPTASPWIVSGEGEDRGPDCPWDPLADDGDALRLVVDLGMDIVMLPGRTDAYCKGSRVTEYHGDDPRAATRRAIVRAAAEIGAA